MPTNLPEIEQLLADWYSLTLDNPVFVGVLVLVVWLFVALIYNFKILFLNKKQKAAEKLNLELQGKVTAAEQQLQQQKEKQATDAEQMEKDQHLIAEIQDKLAQRNHKIVENLKFIAGKFDLSEQLVDSDKDMKDEFIWQQQDNIIQQLSDRLSVAQQENAKANEKDTLISNLQNSLDKQIKQFAQLEQAIEVQKHVLQEQQKEVQQQLSNTLEKHQLDFTQLIETVQNRSAALDVESQSQPAPEQSVPQEDQKPENIAQQQIVEFSAIDQLNSKNFEPEPATEPEDLIEQKEKNEQDVAHLTKPLAEAEIEPVSQQDPMIQDLLNIAEPTFSTVKENVTQQAEINQSADAKTSSNVTGKFKSLLGKVKKSDTKTKPENISEALAANSLKAPDANTTQAASASVSGKFKSLLGKAKKSGAKTEPEQKTKVNIAEDHRAPEPEQKIEVFTAEAFKVPEAEQQQIETFIADDFKAPEVEEVHVDPDYGSSNFKMPGTFKKLFGKKKK
ncbi:hypothetical protein AU255_16700 [Methyloprofundus sedimenti]|uniref:Uncharacterized protein n=1 Tax=Methyloprofundus sedimenti TaxID=1420851 RepID=A0A1V8M2P1_9GAMM|nr:hypothetical protein [Methyloprofundus sedimenti]OQK15830.1 hypothetical protein AU255_16700 [Methyloprofundus sedimenti]